MFCLFFFLIIKIVKQVKIDSIAVIIKNKKIFKDVTFKSIIIIKDNAKKIKIGK